jgi:dihydroxy-acid dehydratase
MHYSLVSREVIAESIETVVACEGFDGVAVLGGCDKNMPAALMAIARLNRPAVFVYGGTILPGCVTGQRLAERLHGGGGDNVNAENNENSNAYGDADAENSNVDAENAQKLDIVSVFEAVGAHSNALIDDDRLAAVEACAIPGEGSCGGMYTANTMASAIEALGMRQAVCLAYLKSLNITYYIIKKEIQ